MRFPSLLFILSSILFFSGDLEGFVASHHLAPLTKSKALKEKLPFVTTKKGDKGYTRLFTGEQVQKNVPQIHLVGLLDELNVRIGQAKVKRQILPQTATLLQKDIQFISGIIASVGKGKTEEDLMKLPWIKAENLNDEAFFKNLLYRLELLRRLAEEDKTLQGLVAEIAYYFLFLKKFLYLPT